MRLHAETPVSDALVLVPGLQSDASSWLPLMHELCHTQAISVPMGHQFAPDIGTMAEVVLAQSPQRFHLIGWSMGGYIAFEILRRAPERLTSLILISTMAAPESDASRARRAETLHRADVEGMRGYQKANMALCLHNPAGIPDANMEHLLKASEKLGIDALRTQIQAIVDRPDSRPDLAACASPTMIIVGKDDQIIPPENAFEMHALRPESRLHVMKDCGHCPPIERPGDVADMIRDWVETVESAPPHRQPEAVS